MENVFAAEEVWQFFAAPFQKAVEFVGNKLGADVYLRNAFFTVLFYEDLLGEYYDKQAAVKKTKIIKEGLFNFVKGSVSKNLILNGAFTAVSFPNITVNHFGIKAVNRLAPFYFPQEIEYSEIELTKGITVAGSPFWRWLSNFHSNYEVEYKTVIIVHLARLGQVAPFFGELDSYVPWFPVRMLFLYLAFPGSYGATDFDALNGEISLERVTLHFSYFDTLDLMDLAKSALQKLGILK